MKNIILSITVCMVMLSSNALAESKDYRLCSISGFFLGIKSSFKADLATYILINKGLRSDACLAAQLEGMRIGEAVISREKLNKEEQEIFTDASQFSNKLMIILSTSMGY